MNKALQPLRTLRRIVWGQPPDNPVEEVIYSNLMPLFLVTFVYCIGQIILIGQIWPTPMYLGCKKTYK